MHMTAKEMLKSLAVEPDLTNLEEILIDRLTAHVEELDAMHEKNAELERQVDDLQLLLQKKEDGQG